MADTTTKGFPYPEGADAVDVAGDIQALAEAVDAMPGVQSYTGTQIAGLATGAKWAGRIVWNSTTGKLQVSNGSTFSDVDTSVALSSSTPQTLGTAAAGTSSDASRADHRHAMPSASDVGAVANSLINAKGDLITGTADNTPAIQTVGSNGQMLMADSGATNGLRYVDPPANRNLVINGAMQVHQRATSVASLGEITTYATADRWLLFNGVAGVWTQSVENDAPSGSGFRKSLKMSCTTSKSSLSAGDLILIRQHLEGQDVQRIRKGTAQAQQLTLSFWVKTNVTGTYIVYLKDEDNGRFASASYSVSASATWQYVSVSFPADASGVLDNDNATSLIVHFVLVAGSNYTSGSLATAWTTSITSLAVGQTNLAAATNNYWQVTGVQLETGPVATPFEFEPFEATLRKCQRYYYRITPGALRYPFGMGQAYSTTAALYYIPTPVSMRVAPSALEQSGTAGDYRATKSDATNQTCSAVPTFNVASTNGFEVIYTFASGMTAGNASMANATNATAYLAVSAEL